MLRRHLRVGQQYVEHLAIWTKSFQTALSGPVNGLD